MLSAHEQVSLVFAISLIRYTGISASSTDSCGIARGHLAFCRASLGIIREGAGRPSPKPFSPRTRPQARLRDGCHDSAASRRSFGSSDVGDAAWLHHAFGMSCRNAWSSSSWHDVERTRGGRGNCGNSSLPSTSPSEQFLPTIPRGSARPPFLLFSLHADHRDRGDWLCSLTTEPVRYRVVFGTITIVQLHLLQYVWVCQYLVATGGTIVEASTS
jgi:hypothetical protein